MQICGDPLIFFIMTPGYLYLPLHKIYEFRRYFSACTTKSYSSPVCVWFTFATDHGIYFADHFTIYCRPEPPCTAASDPVVKGIMDCCDRLYHLIRQWNREHSDEAGKSSSGEWVGEGEEEGHASSCIASDVRQLIVSWLANRRMVGAMLCSAV